MDRAVLTSLLSAFDSPRWRRSVLRGDAAKEVRWLPVLDLHGHGLYIGLADGGDWVIESVDGLVTLTSEDALDSLLDCLYFPREEIERRLRDGIEALGLPGLVIESFPAVELVAHAFGFSPFYADLALDWIESGPRRVIFLARLEQFAGSQDGRTHHDLRHRAERLYDQIQHESDIQPGEP